MLVTAEVPWNERQHAGDKLPDGWTGRIAAAAHTSRAQSGPDLSVWRPWAGSVGRQEAHPACENRVVECWCGCLSGARCRQLYDLHKLYDLKLFFYSRLSVSKSILMFP